MEQWAFGVKNRPRESFRSCYPGSQNRDPGHPAQRRSIGEAVADRIELITDSSVDIRRIVHDRFAGQLVNAVVCVRRGPVAQLRGVEDVAVCIALVAVAGKRSEVPAQQHLKVFFSQYGPLWVARVYVDYHSTAFVRICPGLSLILVAKTAAVIAHLLLGTVVGVRERGLVVRAI